MYIYISSGNSQGKLGNLRSKSSQLQVLSLHAKIQDALKDIVLLFNYCYFILMNVIIQNL